MLTQCLAIAFVLKLKYLKSEKENNSLVSVPVIQNKIIGVATMKEDSYGKAFIDLITEKLFVNDEIRRNFIGITHDNAQALSSEQKGLIGRLKDELKRENFMDLPDPCHGASLVALYQKMYFVIRFTNKWKTFVL